MYASIKNKEKQKALNEYFLALMTITYCFFQGKKRDFECLQLK
jgi:hypothetical protein